MNWLAHLFLSERSAEFRLGNLLPDLVPPAQWGNLSEDVLRGIKCHRKIDAFTDSHPIVRRSIGRIEKPFRKFGGVLVDIFYDHFLAVDWRNYSDVPLEAFAQEVYPSLETMRSLVPETAFARLQRMKDADYLCSYQSIEGIEKALSRIGRRLKRPVSLGLAISELRNHYDALHGDFSEFFPELRQHVGTGR